MCLFAYKNGNEVKRQALCYNVKIFLRKQLIIRKNAFKFQGFLEQGFLEKGYKASQYALNYKYTKKILDEALRKEFVTFRDSRLLCSELSRFELKNKEHMVFLIKHK